VSSNEPEKQAGRDMALHTLSCMAAGGIHDHVGKVIISNCIIFSENESI